MNHMNLTITGNNNCRVNSLEEGWHGNIIVKENGIINGVLYNNIDSQEPKFLIGITSEEVTIYYLLDKKDSFNQTIDMNKGTYIQTSLLGDEDQTFSVINVENSLGSDARLNILAKNIESVDKKYDINWEIKEWKNNAELKTKGFIDEFKSWQNMRNMFRTLYTRSGSLEQEIKIKLIKN